MKAIELAKWTVEQARKAGADQVSVRVSKNREIQVQYREGELEKLKETTSSALDLEIYVNHRFLVNTTNDLKKETLKALAAEAVESAKYLPPDEYRALPDPKYHPKDKGSDLKIDDPAYNRIDTSQRKKIAAEMEKVAASQSHKVVSTTCSYSDSSGQKTLANSNGFVGSFPFTNFSLYAEVFVDGADRGRPMGWDWAQTRFMNDLPKPEFIAKNAVKRALSRIGQEKIESCTCNMIVENRIVGGRLLRMLLEPATARSLQQKRSFLDGKAGRKIASPGFTLADDPLIEKGQGSRPFDSEGLAARRIPIIEKGILQNYYVDNYYGRKLGMELTTGGTSNIVIIPGEKTLEQLIAGCEKAILVTNCIGGNSNPTTGDFSIGIMGELIENGKKVRPVAEMNIAGNALELWSRIEEVGSDVFEYSQNRTPSVLFKDVAFSGI